MKGAFNEDDMKIILFKIFILIKNLLTYFILRLISISHLTISIWIKMLYSLRFNASFIWFFSDLVFVSFFHYREISLLILSFFYFIWILGNFIRLFGLNLSLSCFLSLVTLNIHGIVLFLLDIGRIIFIY